MAPGPPNALVLVTVEFLVLSEKIRFCHRVASHNFILNARGTRVTRSQQQRQPKRHHLAKGLQSLTRKAGINDQKSESVQESQGAPSLLTGFSLLSSSILYEGRASRQTAQNCVRRWYVSSITSVMGFPKSAKREKKRSGRGCRER